MPAFLSPTRLVMSSTKGRLEEGNISGVELGVLWASTIAFTATIWFGERLYWWIGGGMLVGYVGFIGAEFAVIHRVAGSSYVL
jgi:hypothetical protein